MSSIPTIVVTPSMAVDAYERTDRAGDSADNAFGSTLRRAIHSLVQGGHEAEAEAMHAISGEGDLTQVVVALSHAQLALQTATAIRDRVVQAYQDIMKMPI